MNTSEYVVYFHDTPLRTDSSMTRHTSSAVTDNVAISLNSALTA